MNAGKDEFVSPNEELLEDAISIEDIDDVLLKLQTAGIVGTESDEPLIEQDSAVSASADDSDEPLADDV